MSMTMYVLSSLAFVAVIFIIYIIRGALTAPPPSGFLSNYSRMARDPTDPGLKWWEKPGVNWSKYKMIKLDPVEIRLHPDAKAANLPQTIQTDYAKRFKERVGFDLGSAYILTDTIDSEVLGIRSALTDIGQPRRCVNVLSALVLGFAVDTGGAAMEVVFYDAETGETLGEVIARSRRPLLAVNRGIFTRQGDVESAFKKWSKALQDSLEEVNFHTKIKSNDSNIMTRHRGGVKYERF